MILVYTNADFISCNDHDMTYSVMVVKGKEIVYVGYNIPLCYEDEKVIDLKGQAVLPFFNDYFNFEAKNKSPKCKTLREGEQADFIVIDKNIKRNSDADIQLINVYIKGKPIL